MDEPVQEVRSHAGLFLALGTQGSWEDGTPFANVSGELQFPPGQRRLLHCPQHKELTFLSCPLPCLSGINDKHLLLHRHLRLMRR